MNCPHCSEKLRFDDINIETGLAKCYRCEEAWSIRQEQQSISQSRSRRAPAPGFVKVTHSENAVTLQWSWFRWHHVILIPFLIAWNPLALTGFCAGVIAGIFEFPNGLLIVFGTSPHMAAGIGLTYYVVAGFKNSTRLRIDDKNFSVTHGPLPWVGACQMSVDRVDQLYCSPTNWVQGKWSSFDVWVILDDNSSHKLLRHLHSLEHALFVEETLEQILGLEHRLVPGEVRYWYKYPGNS